MKAAAAGAATKATRCRNATADRSRPRLKTSIGARGGCSPAKGSGNALVSVEQIENESHEPQLRGSHDERSAEAPTPPRH